MRLCCVLGTLSGLAGAFRLPAHGLRLNVKPNTLALRMMAPEPELVAGTAQAIAPVLDQIGTSLSFSDQGNNLAGIFFQFSLPSYLAFLYFIGYEKNRTPKVDRPAHQR